MTLKFRRAWDLPERLASPEAVFLNRRHFMAAAAGAATILAGGRAFAADDPNAKLYPAPLNPAFKDAGRPVTSEEVNTTYNNYYEFGSSKQISRAAALLKTRPWQIAIDGLVEKPFTLEFDDLLKQVTLEDRVVRHRCVEAWSMVVPWSGFTVQQLVALARPTGDAKYVRFETFNDPEQAPGQKPGLFSTYPWPYVEGITMAEAASDLAFLATGAYGKPLPNSMGAPVRLHLPWKFGFKSIKAITRVSFVKERPLSFWEQIQASEYGFWANVNPEVPHPRWSQAQERVLGSGEFVPTLLYNGYGEWVADLYKGLEGEKLYM